MAGRSAGLVRRRSEKIIRRDNFPKGTILIRMWRVLMFLSVLPIAAALIARWWFGTRLLTDLGGRSCKCDLARWLPCPGDTEIVHRAEESAYEFGRQLRLKALADWRESNPKAASSRENSKRFGMAVPPLSGMVAVMAVLVAKIPVMGSISIILAATALSCVLGILSLAPELSAISRAAAKLRGDRTFPRSDDEDAVVKCALAHAWKETLPPILNLLVK